MSGDREVLVLMDCPEKTFSKFVGILKSWIPRRSEPANVSKDFWMPDHSCRVCYECDSQFTVFNRRHHCRLCGRVFCAKCTSNSVPVSDKNNVQEGGECIRVCNFCFKQWEQDKAQVDEKANVSSLTLSPYLSSASMVSAKSVSTAYNSFRTASSFLQSNGHYPCIQVSSGSALGQSVKMGSSDNKSDLLVPLIDANPVAVVQDIDTANEFEIHINRDDDSNEYVATYAKTKPFQQCDDLYDEVDYGGMDTTYHYTEVCPAEEDDSPKEIFSQIPDNTDYHDPLWANKMSEDTEPENAYDHDMSSSLYCMEEKDGGSVDFESNGLLWLPPDPEDEEDDKEAELFDDEEEYDATGQWRYFCDSNSLGSYEHQSRNQTSEEQKMAMKNVVGGHFRALVAQLLQVENLFTGEDDEEGSWLEIITSLSWEAATFLKPDTSKGGGMDLGVYVKIKCIPCGTCSQSMIVKGVVCKKNVSHRRMASRIEKPRFLILGGALEYQRVTNLLSSFDTLLQQEMDHLKMAVAKIEAHHPDVLLVEKSVSRFAQDYLLEKNISLVLNIKRPLLDRIARCTGAQIVPSIDQLSSQKLGHCDLFHVEKFSEEHGAAGIRGKKMMKNLMFFEGCPKPLGCTVLLKGAGVNELKKVKHVLQYAIFAAYHLAMETSFLADEGASLPEVFSGSPLTVSLPDQNSNVRRPICSATLTVAAAGMAPPSNKSKGTNMSCPYATPSPRQGDGAESQFSEVLCYQIPESVPTFGNTLVDMKEFPKDYGNPENVVESEHRAVFSYPCTSGTVIDFSHQPTLQAPKSKNRVGFAERQELGILKPDGQTIEDDLVPDSCNYSEESKKDNETQNDCRQMTENQIDTFDTRTLCHEKDDDERITSQEEFPPASDHQSILVSLSTRCVWKGTVCDQPHLFRIRFYGSSDKPLGRFLRDDLFDQSYLCRSCDMPSEAHVHFYTHMQGSLTISVRKLPGFLLAGERDGKIWMWHRCLRCPQIDGLPPSTQRVVMSDAAWGLSFGKFLDLSFSNHAAAFRVASCGHSIHKDCLRFYGFGRMVACFRYAPIYVHSVYLPPLKLKFEYQIQDWIQKEANEVADWAKLLFTNVLKALSQITEKSLATGALDVNVRELGLPRYVVELKELLRKETMEINESVQKLLKKEAKEGQPVIDILEVNKLKRQLLFQSYLWDQRLIYATSGTCELPCDLLTTDRLKLDSNLNTTPIPQGVTASSDACPSDDKANEIGSTHLFEQQVGLHDHLNDCSIVKQRSDVELGSFQLIPRKNNLTTTTSASDQLDLLEPDLAVRRTLSDGHFPLTANLSDALDAKWTGESGPVLIHGSLIESSASVEPVPQTLFLEDSEESGVTQSAASLLPTKKGDSTEDFLSRIGFPFLNVYRSFNKNWYSSQRFDALRVYNPIYLSFLRETEQQNGAMVLPSGVNDTVIPIYDDEPTSIISFALVSTGYHFQMLDEQERIKDAGDPSLPFDRYGSVTFHLFHSSDDLSESDKSVWSTDESSFSMSGSRSSLVPDPLKNTKPMHVRVSFAQEGKLGKVKYTVTCYYAKGFDTLRRSCCPSELDFIRSLSRCKKWGAQGGKSNVFFAKSLDDRFIIKQVTKTELESFIKFAPEYFKYLSLSINTKSPTCLAKILGIYQVASKHLRSGKESRMDLLVMENLLFRKKIMRLYDLKGSSRSRYNPDSSGTNKVLLDQNLIEAMPTSPIFVGNKAKRLLERAVWNDTSFLASVDVMDYSLLVGIDEERELVIGIIDFMRQYTWDKHLETWVKTSGILGGPRNALPTVISPKQYKKRFRKAMTAYFLMVPDLWLPATTNSEPNLNKDDPQSGVSLNP